MGVLAPYNAFTHVCRQYPELKYSPSLLSFSSTLSPHAPHSEFLRLSFLVVVLLPTARSSWSRALPQAIRKANFKATAPRMVLLKFSAIALAAVSLIAPSTAHLTMSNPVPFGADTLTTSPLANAKIGTPGSDFPCKQRPGVYDITAMNNMKVGDPQKLDFKGSASHGGGTCQIAVSMDPEPTANSTWKIIQVFEGGCPIDANGNAGTHPFTFVIPEKFPNGRATLAWTWYNRIGNREIYMNCGKSLSSNL